MKQIEGDEKSFLDTIVNFAIVIRADLATINEIKQDLAHNPNVDVVYQKFSFDKLYIREDGDVGDSPEREDTEFK
ncbi:hypothetical protein MBGDF03_00124 [Thermoplasmatales archaeon SCGC AB-540-F20]|nr:hypothetical protein MBGDF03_00124 [Thermoplasmatales archaeon SCGC AB-540-F20]